MLQTWKRTYNLIRRRQMGYRSAIVEVSGDEEMKARLEDGAMFVLRRTGGVSDIAFAER